jgi:hypothetical protein
MNLKLLRFTVLISILAAFNISVFPEEIPKNKEIVEFKA